MSGSVSGNFTLNKSLDLTTVIKAYQNPLISVRIRIYIERDKL
jgi:hypothetical protein